MTATSKGMTARAAGAILGMAAGDALGAPYEFGATRTGVRFAGTAADMVGGKGWGRGEWTDDTAMAFPILQVAASGSDLRTAQAQDQIFGDWVGWARVAKDVGIQTRQVLARSATPTAADGAIAAYEVHVREGRSGGNGSVMRTAPVGLAFMGDPDGPAKVADAARAIAALTHYENDARDAAALWSVLVHLAVRDGRVELADALAVLDEPARSRWTDLLDEATGADPDSFAKNGWVVHAVQAAWAAIIAGGLDTARPETHTPEAFRAVLQTAVDIHNDTDTVAAIAGSLAGALVGAQAMPLGWQRMLHGWPGDAANPMGAEQLVKLAVLAAKGGEADADGWLTGARVARNASWGSATVVAHPHDAGVLLGGVLALRDLPTEVDAVVSLCQLGSAEVPTRIAQSDRVAAWLIDGPADQNPYLAWQVAEAADAVAELRAAGKVVFLHCMAAASRTPTVAAAYAVRHKGVPASDALAGVAAALGAPIQNDVLAGAVLRMGGAR